MNMLHSLRFRLLLTLIALVVVAVGSVALFASRVTSREFQRYAELDIQRNRQLTETIMTYYAKHKDGGDPQELVWQVTRGSGERVILTDDGGKVQADSADLLMGQTLSCGQPIPAVIITVGGPFCLQPPATKQLEYAQPAVDNAGIGDVIFLGGTFITAATDAMPASPAVGSAAPLVAQKIGQPGPSIIIRRTQGQEPDPIEAGFLGAVNRSLLWSALAAGIAALLLTLALSRRILAPIEALTAAARGMERGDLSRRVQVRSGDEIGQLAHAFNAMADGLERQEQLRRNMVTDVAHELRTPLTNIRGYLEALRDGVALPTPSAIESLHEEALLLNRLVDDLQELSRAEAGQLRLALRPAALAEIVEQAAGALHPAASGRGICVKLDLPPDLPPVLADPERVGQIVRNLLANAITHTPPGGRITVSAAVLHEDQDTKRQGAVDCMPLVSLSPCVLVSVLDTGPGIAPEHLPNIFERFYRADGSRARATGGAGLGLAIVRQLVAAHGGRVWAASKPGEGACFRFTLPCVCGETESLSRPIQ
jgi:signal transduction histidine kinase